MATPRSQLVSPRDTPFYHCVSRCVRRAFLCGIDPSTDTDYTHRRQWIEERIEAVAHAFAIEVAAFAIMSNHYHLVVRIDTALADSWTGAEVIERWHRLFEGEAISHRFLRDPERLLAKEREVAEKLAETWRARLCDLSWFMRAINEPIARRVNGEDDCTGRFWEGRFKSQALLDEQALLACMAYVDLNPIRAGIADTPESSEHTSVKRRIEAAAVGSIPSTLARFKEKSKPSDKLDLASIPFTLLDYLELVDWTGRQLRDDKRGAIATERPPILKRLKIDSGSWLRIATTFEQSTRQWVGAGEAIQRATISVGKVRSRSPPLALSA